MANGIVRNIVTTAIKMYAKNGKDRETQFVTRISRKRFGGLATEL